MAVRDFGAQVPDVSARRLVGVVLAMAHADGDALVGQLPYQAITARPQFGQFWAGHDAECRFFGRFGSDIRKFAYY
jgi:hypothetical protein